MSAYPNTPSNWSEANALLGKRTSRKIGNNTYLERRYFDSHEPIAVRLHNTDIVIFHDNGVAALYSGGWQTVTTKDRLNKVLRPLGVGIVQRNHVWTVHGEYHEPVRFIEGFIVKTGGARESVPAFSTL